MWFARPRSSVQDCGMASYDLEDRLIDFGSTACRLGERFPRTAESRRDFIHKLGICLKELRETRTWLKFVKAMSLTSTELVDPALRECDELLTILATSIKTARRNGQRPNDH